MEYAFLGTTNIRVSKICIGGMSFGQASEQFHPWTLNQDSTTEIIEKAYDSGINFIDTANSYSNGTSEIYIGNAIKRLGIPRDKLVLASKVYFNEGKLSKEAILREIEGTLSRLQTSYLDLYQIHRFDYHTPIEETMETLNFLIQSGKVRAIGASAMFGYQFQNMQIVAQKNHWATFQTMQNHYNLLYREDERELIPICQQYGVSLIPYSPLAGGHLTHPAWESNSLRSKTDKVLKNKYDQAKENDLEIIKRVQQIAQKYQRSMAQIALAWLYSKKVTSPIVGATSWHHFEDAIQAMNLKLTEEEIRSLEELYEPHQIVGAIQKSE